jgi:hypothetical protein
MTLWAGHVRSERGVDPTRRARDGEPLRPCRGLGYPKPLIAQVAVLKVVTPRSKRTRDKASGTAPSHDTHRSCLCSPIGVRFIEQPHISVVAEATIAGLPRDLTENADFDQELD